MLDRSARGYPIETRRGADCYALSLMLFLMMGSLALSLVPIVRDQLQEAPYLLSDSQIGLLTSVFMLTFAGGALLAGVAISRWGGPTLLLGGVCLVGGSVLFAVSSSYPWFLLARFLQGVGGSAFLPGCNALIAHSISPRYQDRALGIMGCGWGLGVIATLLIMPSVQEAGGFRAVFLTAAGIALLTVAVAAMHPKLRCRSRMLGSDPAFSGLARTIKSIATNRRLLPILMVQVGGGAISVGVLTWTPGFLHDQKAASLAMAAYLTAGFGLAQLLGNPTGAAAMARWGKPVVLVVGLALILLITALIPVVPGMAAVFICVVVVGFLSMVIFPAILGSIADVVPRSDQVGPASGYMTLVGLLGSMLAPWLFGVLLDSHGATEEGSGYLWGYLLLGLFAMVGTVAAVAYMLVRRRDVSAAAGMAVAASLTGTSGAAGPTGVRVSVDTAPEMPAGTKKTGA